MQITATCVFFYSKASLMHFSFIHCYRLLVDFSCFKVFFINLLKCLCYARYSFSFLLYAAVKMHGKVSMTLWFGGTDDCMLSYTRKTRNDTEWFCQSWSFNPGRNKTVNVISWTDPFPILLAKNIRILKQIYQS